MNAVTAGLCVVFSKCTWDIDWEKKWDYERIQSIAFIGWTTKATLQKIQMNEHQTNGSSKRKMKKKKKYKKVK